MDWVVIHHDKYRLTNSFVLGIQVLEELKAVLSIGGLADLPMELFAA
jgi:hypothetical protein